MSTSVKSGVSDGEAGIRAMLMVCVERVAFVRHKRFLDCSNFQVLGRDVNNKFLYPLFIR